MNTFLTTSSKIKIVNNEVTLDELAFGDIYFNSARIYNDLNSPNYFEVSCEIDNVNSKAIFDPSDNVEGKYCAVYYSTSQSYANTEIVSPLNNDFLVYDEYSERWKNKNPTQSRTALDLGTISLQNSDNVNITGGTITGTSGNFTTLSASSIDLTNASDLSLETGVTGILPIENGGTGNTLGKATTAATLEIAKLINGTSFDGSTDITTVSWGASRNISFSGDVTGSSSVNGSTDITTDMTLSDTGVISGTYTKLTVDSKGRITSGESLISSDIPNLDASKITSGTIDPARLPSFVDDVLEFADFSSLPLTGETGKIYITLDTNKTYRWSGSTYVYITSGAVEGINAGNAITISSSTGVVTVNHADTSSQIDVSNTGTTFVQSLTFDDYGHVVEATSGSVTIGDGTLTLNTSGIATGSQTFTANQNTNSTFTVNVPGTDISEGTRTATSVSIDSSTGTSAVLSSSTSTLAGVMSSSDKLKLDGIEAGAQVNTVNTVSGRTGDVVLTKNDVELSNVDNTSDLNKPISTATQTALDGKLGVSENAVSASVLETPRLINGTSFDGSTDITTSSWGTSRTISFSGDVTGSQSINGSTDASVSLTLSNSGVTAGSYTKLTVDSKGRVTSGTSLSASDIPNLDASKIISGTIDPARLPSYVDDVLEFADFNSFPLTGETGKIYVDLTTNKTYRWGGSSYIYITSGAVDSVAGKTGVVTLTKSDVGLGNVDNTADSTKNVLSATKLTTARTISLSGDVTGSVSFDGSSNVTITSTVQDDSHNHIISNVDGLQAALDGKSDTTHNHTLDSLSDTVITSNTNGEILKWNGTAWVNNTLSEAGIQPAGSYLTATTEFGGDVSGTYNAIVIANDSHNHSSSSGDFTVGGNLLVNGNLTISGTTTTVNSTTLDVADLNITIGKGTTTDTEANGAGLTFGGHAGAATFNYISSTDRLIASNVNGIESTNFYGSLSGNASTSSKLETARTISLSGDASGSASFDGSQNVTLSVIVADDSHSHVISNVDGLQTALDEKAPLTGTGASGTWEISITGNSGTATTLQTARTLAIGNTGKSFDGSSDVSWSLAEIGALPSSGGTVSGSLSVTENIGIGTSSPTAKLDVVGSTNISGNATIGTDSTNSVRLNGLVGVSCAPNTAVAMYLCTETLSGVAQNGFFSNIMGNSESTLLISGFTSLPRTSDASFTVADVFGYRAKNAFRAGGSASITRLTGLYIEDQTEGVNNYGLRSDVSAGTNKWNIYVGGTANNYFAGNVGIGTTSLTHTLTVDGTASFTGTVTAPTFSGNASTSTKLQTSRTISLSGAVIGSASFDGSQDITISATLTGSLGTDLAANRLAIDKTSDIDGDGISLWNGQDYSNNAPTYGLFFAGTSTFGTHSGGVTGAFATYFTMNGGSVSDKRGWIFKGNNTNVASITYDGIGTFSGLFSDFLNTSAISATGAIQTTTRLIGKRLTTDKTDYSQTDGISLIAEDVSNPTVGFTVANTSVLGSHGDVTSRAVYFRKDNTAGHGWIFKSGLVSVASIDNLGSANVGNLRVSGIAGTEACILYLGSGATANDANKWFIENTNDTALRFKRGLPSSNKEFFTMGTFLGSDFVRIGDITTFVAPSVYNTTVSLSPRAVYVDSTGLFGYVTSTLESKNNIENITDTSWLLNLRPVEYKKRKVDQVTKEYLEETYDRTEFGLIAEEVIQVQKDLCYLDKEGNPEGVDYTGLISPMLAMLQNISQRLTVLEEKINK